MFKNGRETEAEISAKLLHGENYQESVFSRTEKAENPTSKIPEVNFIRQYWQNVKEIFDKKHIRIPTLHLLLLYWNQNLSGALVMLFYTTAIFQQVGVPANYVSIAIVSFFAVNFIASLFSGMVLDKWGRKLTYTISVCGMGVCMSLVFGFSFFDSHKANDSNTKVTVRSKNVSSSTTKNGRISAGRTPNF